MPRGSRRSPRASRLSYAVPPARAPPPAAGLRDRRPPHPGGSKLRLSRLPGSGRQPRCPRTHFIFIWSCDTNFASCVPPSPPSAAPRLRTQTQALLDSAPLRSLHRDGTAVPASSFPGGKRLSFPHPGSRGWTFTVTSLSPTRSKGSPSPPAACPSLP